MTHKRIKLADLIDAQIVTPPFSIHARFKGKDFSAKIDKDGFILLAGKRHTSLSIAGGMVRSSMSGKPADGLAYRRVNGWLFWKFRAADGRQVPIDELRKQYTMRDRQPRRQLNGSTKRRSR